IETGFAPMRKDKTKIGLDQCAHAGAGRGVEAVERPEPHQHQRPRCWTVVLRARPFADVERGVRIEPRLAKNTVPRDRAKLIVVAHELQKSWIDVFPEITRRAQKAAAIKTAEREAERNKLLEAGEPLLGETPLHDHMAQ